MISTSVLFFFNDTATTEIYTLSLHDALPICRIAPCKSAHPKAVPPRVAPLRSNPWRSTDSRLRPCGPARRRTCATNAGVRSEEHTSELQSRQYLVCRLLLEKKKTNTITSSLL